MKKWLAIIISCSFLVLLSSCDYSFKKESINRHIFPYLSFEASADGTSYSASVLKGAGIKHLIIPGVIKHDKGTLPVKEFSGYKDPSDAAALETLTLGSGVGIGIDAIKGTLSLKSITVTDPLEGALWHLPEKMESDTGHFIGWKAGDSFIENNTPINPAAPVAVPVFEPHQYAIMHDNSCHWTACKVCMEIIGEKQAHDFKNLDGKQVCTYCGYEKSESSGDGGFDVGAVDKAPDGTLSVQEIEENSWVFRFIDRNPDYPPTAFRWFINDAEQLEEIEPEFSFVATEKQSYVIMCVFWNEDGIGSVSVKVTGK